jgi:cytochrome c556
MIRIALVLAFVLGCKAKDCPKQECPPPAPAPAAPTAAPVDAEAPGNVVQTEMRLMTKILEATVRGIGAGDVSGIDEQLHELHAAKEATEAAVKSGTYKLAKNPDSVAAFTAMDEAFHAHLGALVKASRANDVAGASEALGQIMRGCHGCHTTFRVEPNAPANNRSQ